MQELFWEGAPNRPRLKHVFNHYIFTAYIVCVELLFDINNSMREEKNMAESTFAMVARAHAPSTEAIAKAVDAKRGFAGTPT